MKVFIFVLIVCLPGLVTSRIGNIHDAFINNLLNTANYSKDLRPVCDVDSAVDVQVGLALRQIIDMIEPRQILICNAWIRLYWNDCRLKWNASDISNLTHFTIPASRVWIPDITLHNYADNENEKIPGLEAYRLTVNYTGDIAYLFPTVIKVFCKINVQYFPFDEQVCSLRFSSWAFDHNSVNVRNHSGEGDQTDFESHVEWDLLGIPLEVSKRPYPCCEEPYAEITFNITLKRKPLFHALSLLFPGALITSISLFGFMLPPDSGEKVTFEVTVLLSLAVFLLVVQGELPASSDNFTYIGIFFALTMVLVALSTLFTVFILNIHYRGEQLKTKVPRWLRRVAFRYVGPLMFVNTKCHKHYTRKNSIQPFDNENKREKVYSTQKGNGQQLPNGVSSLTIPNEKSKTHDIPNGVPRFEAALPPNDISSESLKNLITHLLSSHGDIVKKQLKLLEKNDERKEKQDQQIMGNSQQLANGISSLTDPLVNSKANDYKNNVPQFEPALLHNDVSLELPKNQITNLLSAHGEVVKKQLKLLEKNEERNEKQDKQIALDEEWRLVAIIADRLFLSLFTLFLLITTVTIFAQLLS